MDKETSASISWNEFLFRFSRCYSKAKYGENCFFPRAKSSDKLLKLFQVLKIPWKFLEVPLGIPWKNIFENNLYPLFIPWNFVNSWKFLTWNFKGMFKFFFRDVHRKKCLNFPVNVFMEISRKIVGFSRSIDEMSWGCFLGYADPFFS